MTIAMSCQAPHGGTSGPRWGFARVQGRGSTHQGGAQLLAGEARQRGFGSSDGGRIDDQCAVPSTTRLEGSNRQYRAKKRSGNLVESRPSGPVRQRHSGQ
jgi:hypothetical protein